jgi:hypothetical protein
MGFGVSLLLIAAPFGNSKFLGTGAAFSGLVSPSSWLPQPPSPHDDIQICTKKIVKDYQLACMI